MTREEMKVLEYLKVLQIDSDHEISRSELKDSFLYLEANIKNETIEFAKDARYIKLKEAYDYLYDHIELLNEAIHNILNPNEQTHLYSYSYEEPVKVSQEEEPLKEIPIENLNKMPEIKDRPTAAGIVLSLLSPLIGVMMFIFTKKITPKSSWLYLGLAIVSFIISYLLLYYFGANYAA